MNHEVDASLRSTLAIDEGELNAERDYWRDRWQRLGMPWRTEPEIDKARQTRLAERRDKATQSAGSKPPLAGMVLERADVEWLLATHDGGQGPVLTETLSGGDGRLGLDLRGADLRGPKGTGVNLSNLPLARSRLGWTREEWKTAVIDELMEAAVRQVHSSDTPIRVLLNNLADRVMAKVHGAGESVANLEGCNLYGAHLEESELGGASLENSDLGSAFLQRAFLFRARLSHARLTSANFEGAVLYGALLDWTNLLGAHLDNADCRAATFVNATLYKAVLDGADLSGADLRAARLDEASLVHTVLQEASLEHAMMRLARLHFADLTGAMLTFANLREASLSGASLQSAHLEGTNLASARLGGTRDTVAGTTSAQMKKPVTRELIPPADFRAAHFSSTTNLQDAEIATGGHAISVADVEWGGANLAVIANWPSVRILGDDRLEVDGAPAVRAANSQGSGPLDARRLRAAGLEAAVRANRQLAVALQSQGLTEQSAKFAYRAQILQRRVLRLQRRYLSFFGSSLLYLLAGYGYRPTRTLFWYLATIAAFAFMYMQATTGWIPFGLPAPSSFALLTWYEALILSVSSFHGRGFFQPVQSLGDPVAALASIEAVIGLFIEISFIATFTQRYFGAR